MIQTDATLGAWATACAAFLSVNHELKQCWSRGRSPSGQLMLSTDALGEVASPNGQVHTLAMPCYVAHAIPLRSNWHVARPNGVGRKKPGSVEESPCCPGELLMKAPLLHKDVPPLPAFVKGSKASKVLAGASIQAPPGLEHMASRDVFTAADLDTCSTTDSSSPSSPRGVPSSTSSAGETSCLSTSPSMPNRSGHLSDLLVHESTCSGFRSRSLYAPCARGPTRHKHEPVWGAIQAR
eukprot:CAMPEP_0171091944 /NCGR_PEP_ID=MMETSP0766_2-20121228/35410_1 /TAXON_ID=439317 /ORGANISM="Gambierdiscus australes, Strain CAWD 149" /LENGTH=237 /DNA_ID=CAMNT_0011550129 /DNA_START=72 /DNA_END=788 /DNA_ORIENTATION=-